MKRLEYDKTGNRPLGVNTGCKPFDKQTNYLGEGNVIANTMIGRHIRPHAKTECNGFTSKPGHLQDFDLNPLRLLHTPNYVLQFVREIAKVDAVWLYMFFHYSNNNKIVHGYVVADHRNSHIRTFVLRNEKVVHFARDYVCNVN